MYEDLMIYPNAQSSNLVSDIANVVWFAFRKPNYPLLLLTNFSLFADFIFRTFGPGMQKGLEEDY